MTTGDLAHLIADLVRANGGVLIGKVRLQKTVYLLDQMGLSSGAEYSYHHYGPYSDSIADEVMFAKQDGVIEEESRIRQDGLSYSVFQAQGRPAASIGGLTQDRVRQLLGVLKARSSMILELAATAHWLAVVERVEDWRVELRRRKTLKATPQNVAEAERLLSEIGIGLPA